MPVIKGSHWNEWGLSEEERFFKAYWLFLKRNIGPYYRYEIYCDTKQSRKSYRWNKMHYLINKTRRYEWGLKRKNVPELHHKDSKNEDLLQLADIILGCHFTTANSNSKLIIRSMLFGMKVQKFKCLPFYPRHTPV
jgi:Protein of unknown function (DUF3800)